MAALPPPALGHLAVFFLPASILSCCHKHYISIPRSPSPTSQTTTKLPSRPTGAHPTLHLFTPSPPSTSPSSEERASALPKANPPFQRPSAGMAELPSLAPQGGAGLSAPEAGSAVPFTDAQVDEFREQDRWLPVSVCKTAERRDRLESLCFSEVRVSGQGNFQSASCIPREQLGLPIVLGSQVVLCQDESETTSTTPLATTMDGQPRVGCCCRSVPAVACPFQPHSADNAHQIANVSRIMKNSLPTTAKVSKEAKECVQECVSEFISFIVSRPTAREPGPGMPLARVRGRWLPLSSTLRLYSHLRPSQ